MRGVLRHRDFRLLLAGQTASTIGDRIVFVALALYVTDIGTPTDFGFVLAAHAVPLVGFLLIGGCVLALVAFLLSLLVRDVRALRRI